MKKYLILLCFISLSGSTHAQKSEKDTIITDVKNIIKMDLGDIVSNSVSLSYERMISSRVSISLGVIGKYNTASTSSANANGKYSEITSGIGFTPEIRFYTIPNYHAPRGMYLGASFKYFNETYQEKHKYFASGNTDVIGSYNTIYKSFNLSLGWMFRIKSSFVIDLGVLIGPENISVPNEYDFKDSNGKTQFTLSTNKSETSQLNRELRIAIGYAF